MRLRLAVLALTISLPFQSAMAAGYAVREQSVNAMGAAYAGSAATNTDASYLAYNPAAAALAQGGDLSFSTVFIGPSSSANYSTASTSAGTPNGGSTTPKDFIRNAAIPDLAMRQRLTDRWSVGLSVSVPWGLSTSYPAGYAGRYYGVSTKLLTVNIKPVVAYDIAPNITIAGGIQAQYAKGRLNGAIDIGTIGALYSIAGSPPGGADGFAELNADSWGYGFVLGARATFDGGWTAGISYTSSVHHTLNGPFNFTLDGFGIGAGIQSATGLFTNTMARAKLTTPDKLEIGVRKKFDDRWTGLAEVNWTGWSVFKDLTIVSANPFQPNEVTNAQWNDAWMVALGAEYAASSQWTLRGGVAYDASPIPDATLETRVPDTDRIWVSAGVTYHYLDSVDVSFTVAHLFNAGRTMALNPTQTGNALRGSLGGTTNSSVDVVGLQLAYRWQ